MSRLHEADKKEFIKKFDGLTGRYSGWEVWKDMVWLFAISIANTCDRRNLEAREAMYKHISEKYDAAGMNTFSQLFALLIEILERSPFQDFLGDIFMELGLGNAWAGQFFTPYSVCKAMAEMTVGGAKEKLQTQEYFSVNDPACGAGATLIAVAESMHLQHINYQQDVLFVAQDIDATAALMCYTQLSLLGCAGYVHIGDTLTQPMVGHVLFGDEGANTWYTPLYFAPIWDARRAGYALRGILKKLGSLPCEPKKHREESVEQPAVIEVKKKPRRGSTGQLMFDFG